MAKNWILFLVGSEVRWQRGLALCALTPVLPGQPGGLKVKVALKPLLPKMILTLEDRVGRVPRHILSRLLLVLTDIADR